MLNFMLPERKGALPDCKGVNKVKPRGALQPRAFAFFSPRPLSAGSFFMGENRVAVISVIVEDRTIASSINAILSEFGEYIVGRMGVPYKAKNISVMCVIADAPAEVLNGLTGKIGSLKGVTAKTLMSKI